MIEPSTAVLGGSAVGSISPKSDLLLGSQVAPGDLMFAASSTGIHANGLSLARKLVGQLPDGYASLVPDDPASRCLGEVLLDATPLYGPCLEALQREAVALHYAVHVTGHGWRKLMRAAQPLSYVVDRLPEVPPVLRYLQRLANMDDAQAYGTLNMGVGFVFFIAASDASKLQRVARKLGRELIPIGYVEPGPRRVQLRPLGVTFDGASLQIR
jgi:phosphoribosylformylglycinamidine cyclo-ligase